jgi:Na+/proline symporter
MAFGLFSLLAVSLNYRMVWFGPLGGIRLTSEAFLFGFLAVLAWSRSRNRGWSQAWIAFCAAVLIFNIFIADLSVFFRSALIIW